MKIAVFQEDIIWEAPQWNIDKVSRWIEGISSKNVDLAILPELFDTGTYKVTYKPTIEIMTKLACDCKIAICFSTYIERCNRLCFIYPDGKLIYYDKRHLYPGASEDKYVDKGKKRIIINYMGFRILPQICYDLRFPVWSYNTKENPYDIAIYLAAWPADRIQAWDILLKARAIENCCYVVGVNRVGYKYSGLSKIIDNNGVIIASADADLECSISAEIDLNFRSNFCTFADSETFKISNYESF